MKTKILTMIFTIIVSLISILSASTSFAGNLNSDLLAAAEQGNTNKVKALLKKGADVNSKDNYNNTALMYAAENGHTEIVKTLLDKDVKVNAKDKKGKTALMYAKEKSHTEVIEVLKQYGAKK